MLCDKCGKNEATVYYRQEINGEVTETALCAECAENAGVIGKNAGFFSAAGGAGIGSFLDGFFDTPFALASHRAAGKEKVCPLCGAAYRDIVKSNKCGCARCYDTFREELAATIEKLHGRVKHIGRAPAGRAALRDRENKLASLRRSMAEAVERQDFEAAAKYRDELRTLEQQKGADAGAQG